MLHIRLLWVGKTQESFVREGLGVYLKKLSHYVKVESEEVRPARYASGTPEQWRRQETENLLKRLNPTELSVFLEECGERHTSKSFAQWLEKQMPLGWPRINFVIGGAYGFDTALFPSGVKRLRLSDMTFTHQTVRLILTEQLYRALTIIRGDPYHHD